MAHRAYGGSVTLHKIFLSLFVVGMGGVTFALAGWYFFPGTGWIVWREIVIPFSSLAMMAASLAWFTRRR